MHSGDAGSVSAPASGSKAIPDREKVAAVPFVSPVKTATAIAPASAAADTKKIRFTEPCSNDACEEVLVLSPYIVLVEFYK